MEIAPETLDERVGRFVEGVKAVGVKLTPQRLEIFREVAIRGPSDVDTVFRGVRKRLPTVSLDRCAGRCGRYRPRSVHDGH
jgi:Fur family peroxide stress response transcriptional regulator